MENNKQTSCGCSIGTTGVIAALLSWVVNHSILWAIIHAFCGIFYIVYWILVKLPHLK